MKYNINISQYGAARAGLLGKIDIVDLAVFDAFRDFANSGRCHKVILAGKQWFWIDYNLVIQELPFVPITTKDGVYRRMKNLAAVDIIQFCPDNQRLGRSYFCWGTMYDVLISSSAIQSTPDSIPLRIKNRRGTDEKPEGYGLKTEPPTDENQQDHNTNTIEPNHVTKPTQPKAGGVAEEVILFLNTHCNRSFHVTAENLKFPRARLKAGASVEDLKLIVRHKFSQWSGTDRSEYLRPSTLFQAEKFDAYLMAAKEWESKPAVSASSSSPMSAARKAGIYNNE
jgi:uncharacterized phage protein (TIGR02220 family)